MESFITELSAFFRWLLVSSVQVSVLVCLVFAVKAVVRGRLAIRWHYWLWLLLLVRMILPWAPESKFSVYTFISQAKEAVVAQQAVEVTLPAKTVGAEPKAKLDVSSKTRSNLKAKEAKPPKTIPPAIPVSSGRRLFSLGLIETLSLVWLLGALVLAVFALVCNFRLWRIIKSKRPLTEGKILDLLEDCKAEMGIQTILGVVVTNRVKSPALFGVIRPRLLLPEGMLETISTEELRYIFLHELAHLKRHDIYLGWLMVILQMLHWFNPLVWFAFGRMRGERELACDGLVLSTMGDDKSQAYGQTLVNIFKGFSQIQFTPGVAGILENKSQLKRRITMIAQFKKGSYQWSALAIVLLVVLGGVALTNAETADNLSDINAKVAQLDIDYATLDDVIEIFGEPLMYVWGQETIPKENIPTNRYCMIYPHGFSIFMSRDSIIELRFDSPAAGYVFYDEIRVGSSLDEVLAVLGEPTETVVGELIGWIDGVLYMDIKSREGRCYYQRSDWNVRMFFADYKVSALYVTSSSSPVNKGILREEDLPPTSFINEEGHIVDKVDYPFVNDPEAIGTWESVDIVEYIEDFDPDGRGHRGDSFPKELFILENGRADPSYYTWTKGLLLNPGDRLASEYVIEEINGTTYMFLEDKGNDYTVRHIKPNFYVLKKVPDKVYVEVESITYDKVDHPFVNDPEVIGTWEAIDFVETPEEFDPGQRQWTGDFYLKGLSFYEDGRTSGSWTWEKGRLWHPEDQMEARYVIKQIDGLSYLFMEEWRSGDVTTGGQKAGYYVMKKVINNIIVPGLGIGDFGWGMSKEEVLKRIGKPDMIFYGEERYTLNNLPRTYFMVYEGLISFRILDDLVKDIAALGPRYKFSNGLGVGDSEQKIKQAFGDDFHLKETDWKDYLTYENKGLMFEIDKNNRRVLEINVSPYVSIKPSPVPEPNESAKELE